MKKLLPFCALFSCLYSFAQDNNERSMRDSFTLVMAVTKQKNFESNIQSSPFIVGPSNLQLYPGEKVFIEVEQKDGIITAIKSVKENKNPEKTLEISFIQNATKRIHSNMMLTVKNPFKKNLTYSAKINTMNSNKWVETSIMPVTAGLLGIEMWPNIIISIILNEWKFL